MRKWIFGALVGAFGGALAGALLGLGESGLVTWASAAPDEYWLFLFAVLAYGLFGAVFGIGSAVLWQLVRGGRATPFELAQLGAGLGFLPLGLFVTRYHVNKRIFKEQLNFASASGIVTHLLILLGVVLAALLVVGMVRFLYRRAGWAGSLVGFAVAVGVATVIGTVAGGGDDDNLKRSASAPSSRPNIIVIVADTLRSDAVVERAAQSPDGGFSQIMVDSVSFDWAHSQASWTRPSISSILTSLYPTEHGTVHKMDFLPDRVLTVAEALRDAGYWTAGVTTNINVAPIFNLNQGFGEFAYLEPSFYFGATDSAAKLVIYKTLRTLRERFFADRVYYQHFYQDAIVVNDHVEQWLAGNPPEPFFLFLHYMDPHDPYFEIPYNGRGVARVMNPSPDRSRREELHSLYRQGVRYLDEKLGVLWDELRGAGKYDDALIVFTSDHGEEFLDHDGWWHGTSLYDEVLHVPLIIKLPGGDHAGTRRSDIVRSIDIAPTVMETAGVRVPASFHGTDILAKRVEEPIIAEEDLEGNRIFSIRDGQWKLIRANAGNPRGLDPTELYNVATDPDETNNLAGTHGAKVAELESKLRAMLPSASID